jgi:hypothetical protein
MDLGVVDDQADPEADLLGGKFNFLAIGCATGSGVDGYRI